MASKNEADDVQRLFGELMNAPLSIFPNRNETLNVPTEQGVYVIEDASGNVLHVGRTKKAQSGLQQRLYDHMGATSSFGYEYVKVQGKSLCGVCRYKYLAVPDARLRGLLEHYAIGRLCPEHFGTG